MVVFWWSWPWENDVGQKKRNKKNRNHFQFLNDSIATALKGIWSQTSRKKTCLKMTKLVLNSLTVHYALPQKDVSILIDLMHHQNI